MVMLIGPKKWAFLFLVGSAINFPLAALETSIKKQEQKRTKAEIDERRALDLYCSFIAGTLNSYCVIIASMSGMALAHGFWQTEDLETLVGALGLMVSLGAMLWPNYEVQVETSPAKTDQLSNV